MSEHAAAFAALNTTVVAISPDSAELSQALVDERALAFPILVDADHEVIDRYGLYDAETQTAWPTIYVVDRAGVLRYRGLSETKEKRPTAATVLAALRALPPNAPMNGEMTSSNSSASVQPVTDSPAAPPRMKRRNPTSMGTSNE